jgi:hypothetical protein
VKTELKIPLDAEINVSKIKDYLLTKRDMGDKSEYLLKAGYARELFTQLIDDLKEQILPLDAMLTEETMFGKKFSIIGKLIGPNKKELTVKTIWMQESFSGKWKFITLFPAKEKIK